MGRRLALISDIHGNLPALDAVLADIARQAVDATYHLGDLVGYGPWPNEVVDRIIDQRIAGVAGNCDSTVATDYKHCGCRYEDAEQEALSHYSYEWTRTNVSAETKRYLAALPFRLDVRPLGGHLSGPRLILVHGSDVLNTVYVNERRTDEFLARMGKGLDARAGDIVACGHTHRAWHREVAGVHYVNTGSVGRPKDGDWRAGYVVLDVDRGLDREAGAWRVEFRRVEYDVERAAEAIRGSELPDGFAWYLRSGGASLHPV